MNCLHALLYLASLVCGLDFIKNNLNRISMVFYNRLFVPYYPQPLRAVRVLFSSMVSGWVVGQGGSGKKFVRAVSKKNVNCRKLILGRDIG